jgi:predicted ATPase
VLALASDHGFAQRLAQGRILRGWALAAQGQGAEGIAHVRQGLAEHRATGAKLGEPFYLELLVEAHRKEGQVDEGLRVVAEALALAATAGYHYHELELYRLKGELLLLQAASRPGASTILSTISAGAEAERGRTIPALPLQTEVEACFHQALGIARRWPAKVEELRTAVSLARLWQQQGKRAAARELLAPIYGWFTEGFDTADLREAKALLEELA